ncbi:hypothetical protein BDP27DRAFT_1430101 [Rhodocollybia butyracea]|uniref:Uncharacterized protein n=1 Tax=Rhodocollybia butyracea TaxID=206335 RepID=A0A9P5TZM6_9AGAR|nr:hypothetical protein BDP27DRAFT_1430101 [Rhodocollybia butyracea]
MAKNSPQDSEGRPFVSHYIFPSAADEQESYASLLQLDFQSQYLTKVVYEGRLIDAPTTLGPGDEVLESATGTVLSIWLLNLTGKVPPNVTLTGININQQLLPIEHPGNKCGLVVNQRLVSSALTSEQWGAALSELYRVVKPGGLIQLLERVPETPAYSGSNMKRYVDALVAVCASRGLELDLHRTIDQHLVKTGFINVQKRTVALPRLDMQNTDMEHEGLKRLVMVAAV